MAWLDNMNHACRKELLAPIQVNRGCNENWKLAMIGSSWLIWAGHDGGGTLKSPHERKGDYPNGRK